MMNYYFLKQISTPKSLFCGVLHRSFSCTRPLEIKRWRVSQGLPVNKNAEGPLTDNPDYTFLDGRPTPLLHKQKLRLMKQRGFAAKIVELNEEIQFAIEREKKIKSDMEAERARIISNRLKAKGDELWKKKM